MTRWTIPRTGHGFVVLAHPAAPLSADVRPGDLLVRSAPSLGVNYSAVVVSARPEGRWELWSRGVPVEIAGDGLYVEVAERPVEGGAPRSVGRRLTDAWGRLPPGQRVLRAAGARHQDVLAAIEQAEDEPAQKPKPAQNLPQLTVMTWNIRLGIESSVKAVGDAVLAAGVPDVLALQEIGVDWNMGEKIDQPRVLAKQIGLPHHLFVGAITDKVGGRFGIALLCRWPFVAADVTLLPRETDEQRVLLRARIAVPTPGLNGKTPSPVFSILNTHLSRKPTKERVKQAAVVGAAAAAAAAEGPVVLLGDFNDDPGTATLKAAGGKLVDCFAAAGKGPAETFSVKDPKQRIDYVFCGGGLEPTGPARVVRAAIASDHFPVTAVVGPPPPATP